MKDIQFNEENKRFNIRVTGVVIKDGKILLNRGKDCDFWTFVGGKLTFGESTEEAVIREYEEETGAHLRVRYLSAVVENFFIFDGMRAHEFLYFYVLEDPNNELEVFSGTRDIKDSPNGEIRWFSIDELEWITLQPECTGKMLEGINNGRIDHIINRDPLS